MKCLRCGYEWLPRVSKVKMCPKCKSRDYDKKKKIEEILDDSINRTEDLVNNSFGNERSSVFT